MRSSLLSDSKEKTNEERMESSYGGFQTVKITSIQLEALIEELGLSNRDSIGYLLDQLRDDEDQANLDSDEGIEDETDAAGDRKYRSGATKTAGGGCEGNASESVPSVNQWVGRRVTSQGKSA